MSDVRGLVFDIDTFAVHDGPGIRLAVYVKGCPLSCRWCHSPESQSAGREVIIARDRCVLCGCCAAVCPQSVHTVDDSTHTLVRERCIACGQCVDACAYGALAIKGYWLPASEVVDRAVRMIPFFEHSGGGVTLSGGEVTTQADFAAAVLAGCQSRGIHAAIETCGATSWARLWRLAQHTDLILYDLKLIDEEEHRRWTGVSNQQILANARRLAGCHDDVQIRVPLIPGVTDTEDNLRGVFAFMCDVGLRHVALLPYNASAGAKYEWLDRPYVIEAVPQADEQLQAWVDLACSYGLDAVID